MIDCLTLCLCKEILSHKISIWQFYLTKIFYIYKVREINIERLRFKVKTGEFSNLYGINAYNNPYLNNNDDFLAQQYFAQQAGQIQGQGQTQNQPAFQGYQQPQADTFQKSGSGLTTGLTLGTIAGAGTGAVIYYFVTNPI